MSAALAKPGRLSNNNINVVSNNFLENQNKKTPYFGGTANLHSLGGLVNDKIIKKPPLAPNFSRP